VSPTARFVTEVSSRAWRKAPLDARRKPRPVASRRKIAIRRKEVAKLPGQAPQKIKPKGLSDYFEVLTKAVFQSGMSWRVIEAKWDGFRTSFERFDPKKVARFTPDDVDRLAADTRIVRNRRKIQATIDNAVEMVALDKESGGFVKYLRSHGSFDETVADLRRHFRFLGDTGAYFFLYVVGEKVPPHEEWMASRR
jgi:DNA-3-methyladenine glycosylase I